MSNKMLPSGISIRIRENLIEGSSRTQTTLIIDPIVTLSGDRVTMTDIGDKGYGKIDQGNSREELISWTGITDNTTTYTLTGVVWGVNFHNLIGGVSSNMKKHNSGANFSINTDMHYIAEQFVSSDDFSIVDNSLEWGDGLDNDKTIYAKNGDVNKPFIRYDALDNKFLISNDGVNTFDPEQGGSGVTAGDGISIVAGAVGIDRTDTGVYKTASAGAGDTNKIPVTNTDGLIDSSFIIDSAADTGLEEGADGGTKVKVKSNENVLITADGLAVDHGTTANKLVRLDGSAKLPAVDGSQLANILNTVTSPTVPNVKGGINSIVSTTTTVPSDSKIILVNANLYFGDNTPDNYGGACSLMIMPGIQNNAKIDIRNQVGLSISLSGTTLTISSTYYFTNTSTHLTNISVKCIK